MQIGVEDAVGVFVEDDGLVEVAEAIQPDHGVLSLPTLEEFACYLVALLPEDGRKGVQAWLTHGNDEQGCAGFQREVGVTHRKDGAHLLKFFGDIAAIFLGTVGNYLEVRALNFAPGLCRGWGGMQQRKTSNDAGQQVVMRDRTLGHQSIVGMGAMPVKENFATAQKHAAEGERLAWQRR
jgi:hypothetical protein